MERNKKKLVVGVVVSDAMQKTISVKSERLVQHRTYKKYVRRFTTYKAHDASDEARVGDLVEIQETRPFSKSKRFRLVRIVEKSAVLDERVAVEPDTPVAEVAPAGEESES